MQQPMQQQIIQFQPDQTLSWTEQAIPVPATDEVLLAVAAFGINRPDLLQRAGRYPAPAGASPVPGLEVAGTVIATGSKVTQWQKGDRVCALVNGGGYSNFCVAPASQCLPWPAHYSAAEAACLPEALFTVWHNLFQRGRLQHGENVLIQAGSSGIGTTAIQLARLAGAQVFTTAGSTAKCEHCCALGATLAANYHEQAVFETLQIATAPHGLHVTLDILGGNTVAQHIKLAAVDGRIVNIAVLEGSHCQINMATIMLKRLTLTGSTLRAQDTARKAAIADDIRRRAWQWIERGEYRPVIDATFAFNDVDAAHQRMQNRLHFGKMAVVF